MTSETAPRADTSPRRPARILALGVAATLLVGYLDYVTPPYLGLSLLYMLPVIAVSWFLGWRFGVLLASVAALTWFVAEIAWEHEYGTWVSVWNGLTGLVIFSGAAVLLAQMRGNQDRLLDLERRLSRTDPLTGLDNLRSFVEQAQAARRRDDRQPCCVLYIDMDNFKSLNDSYGHLVGDEFLRDVGRVISETVRASDQAARVGGDEFVIVLADVDCQAATGIGERLIDQFRVLAAKFPRANVAASIGLAHFERHPADASELLRHADEAMYRAKVEGKGRLRRWSEGEAATR